MIDCENWVITANGNGGKPSKEGILRIISERSKMNKISKIYINSSYPAYSDIFLDDVDAQNLFKFDFINLIDGIIEI